jgi:hypothetical protein
MVLTLSVCVQIRKYWAAIAHSDPYRGYDYLEVAWVVEVSHLVALLFNRWADRLTFWSLVIVL